MNQEEFWRDSRSFLERSHISWISTRTWSNWRSLYPDGQGRAESFHVSYDASWVFSIQKELVDLSQWFWKNRNGERSFWLQRSVDHIEPSTPRIWRTTTQTSAILENQRWHQSSSSSFSWSQWSDSWLRSWQFERKLINEDARTATW